MTGLLFLRFGAGGACFVSHVVVGGGHTSVLEEVGVSELLWPCLERVTSWRTS